MKTQLLILIGFSLSLTNAHAQEVGVCYWAVPLRCIIQRRLDQNHLGLNCSPVFNPLPKRAILKLPTKWKNWNGVGNVTFARGLKIKDRTQVLLTNGFTDSAWELEMCEPKECETMPFSNSNEDYNKCYPRRGQ